jgi:hypothetical protein
VKRYPKRDENARKKKEENPKNATFSLKNGKKSGGYYNYSNLLVKIEMSRNGALLILIAFLVLIYLMFSANHIVVVTVSMTTKSARTETSSTFIATKSSRNKTSPSHCDKYGYVVWVSRPYSASKLCGGCMVLWELVSLLKRESCQVWIESSDQKWKKYGKLFEENPWGVLKLPDAYPRSGVIFVYPEIVTGNPFKATRYVHWILYYPGGIGGAKRYPKLSVVACYHSFFCSGEGRIKSTRIESQYQFPLFVPSLKILDTVEQLPPPLSNRTGVLWMMRKGRKVLEWKKKNLPHESLPGTKKNVEHIKIEELCALCNQEFRTFVTYDMETFHSAVAALCGCDSVIFPPPNQPEESLRKLTPGIRYFGFEKKASQKKASPLSFWSGLRQKGFSAVKNFIRITQKWNSSFPLLKNSSE